MPGQPPKPVRILPERWEHYELYRQLKEAIYALPFYFKTETFISGVMATDIFTLSPTLGAAIEDQIVNTLNEMRPIWDPDDCYRLYGFVRQPQTFPDVLLKRLTPVEGSEAILLGVELKAWYLLAKEGEPSFRYRVTPAACNLQDLIVVVPWVLSNVISGSPRAFSPFVESARFAAEYRNYHWQYQRDARSDPGIISPQEVVPYPRKADEISDRPVSDPGDNFGRFARTGIMDTYLEEIKSQLLCGIKARHWLSFLKVFQERTSTQAVERELARLRTRLAEAEVAVDEDTWEGIRNVLEQIERMVLRSR